MEISSMRSREFDDGVDSKWRFLWMRSREFDDGVDSIRDFFG